MPPSGKEQCSQGPEGAENPQCACMLFEDNGAQERHQNSDHEEEIQGASSHAQTHASFTNYRANQRSQRHINMFKLAHSARVAHPGGDAVNR